MSQSEGSDTDCEWLIVNEDVKSKKERKRPTEQKISEQERVNLSNDDILPIRIDFSEEETEKENNTFKISHDTQELLMEKSKEYEEESPLMSTFLKKLEKLTTDLTKIILDELRVWRAVIIKDGAQNLGDKKQNMEQEELKKISEEITEKFIKKKKQSEKETRKNNQAQEKELQDMEQERKEKESKIKDKKVRFKERVEEIGTKDDSEID
ncbi:PREDICTED: stress response protein NST1-like [Polistes canadensis]|uniref:stress response protein NST1-like n=1 Tax=Polistes canadensis TaxID=91411 RepID=UPI000718BE0E|nr:PREDICTED: stress response protein NST1-like [Polistes canadensis]